MKPYDKDGGVFIMNAREYLTKIHTHLQEQNYSATTQQVQ